MRHELRPLFDRVVIKELDPDRVRRSGLLVPPGNDEPPPQHGIVLAVGPGLDWWDHVGVKMPVSRGDHVVFPASAGAWVEIDEERLLVCRVGELLGVLAELPGRAESDADRRSSASGGRQRATGCGEESSCGSAALARSSSSRTSGSSPRLSARSQAAMHSCSRSVRASACANADQACGESGAIIVAASAAETSAPTSPARW